MTCDTSFKHKKTVIIDKPLAYSGPIVSKVASALTNERCVYRWKKVCAAADRGLKPDKQSCCHGN